MFINRKLKLLYKKTLGAVKCEGGNVEMQRKSIKKCVLDRLAMNDLVGKVDSRARKPWITHGVMGKMDEQRKWKNDNNEELQNYGKTEEQIAKNHRQGQRGNILKAQMTRSWNFEEQDL